MGGGESGPVEISSGPETASSKDFSASPLTYAHMHSSFFPRSFIYIEDYSKFPDRVVSNRFNFFRTCTILECRSLSIDGFMMASIYACVDWLKTRNSPAASTICDRTDDPVSTRIQKKRPSLFPLFSYNSHFLSSPSTRALSYARPTRFNFCFVFSGALYVPLYIR